MPTLRFSLILFTSTLATVLRIHNKFGSSDWKACSSALRNGYSVVGRFVVPSLFMGSLLSCMLRLTLTFFQRPGHSGSYTPRSHLVHVGFLELWSFTAVL
eukprot:3652937-Amphidinium_carterae.1